MRAKCRWCKKLVYDKPILGTLHVCLLPEERALVDYTWKMGRWQLEMQRRCTQPIIPVDTESKLMA